MIANVKCLSAMNYSHRKQWNLLFKSCWSLVSCSTETLNPIKKSVLLAKV